MKLIHTLDKIIEYGFYALFFFTPLIFNPSRTVPSFELFEWNKMMFVYVMTTIIIGAWTGKMILKGKISVTKTPFNLPIILFLLSQLLSTLFSIDRHVSIFGYYSRFHGGLLSTVCYTLLFFAYVSNRDIVKTTNLLLYALVSGIVVAGYGILERFGIDAHMWVQDVRSRVFSTLGQPNWLAAYLAILLPISITQLLHLTFKPTSYAKGKMKNEKINPSIHSGLILSQIEWIKMNNESFRLKKYLLSAFRFSLFALFYTCLLFTKSRSGFLGFWVANGIFWIATYEFSRRYTLDARRFFSILHFTFFILNFFIRTPFPQYNHYLTIETFQKTPVVEETKLPTGDTIISVGVTGSEKIRQIVWKGAINIIKDYPLFGTGPETFAYAYYKYRPKEHNLTSEWDFLYNRAHNEFLNVAATSGLVGLSTYLLFILLTIGWTIKSILTIKQFNSKTILILALLASYISILVTNFFGFSVVIIGLYFFLIPAFIFSLTNPVNQSSVISHQSSVISTFQKLLLGILTVFIVYILFNFLKFWLADTLYAQTLSLSKQSEYKDAYPLIVSAINERPGEPVYHDELATITGHLAETALENREATAAGKFVKEAIVESGAALKTSPQNVSFWKTRTRIFFTLSQVDTSFIQDALDSITIAQELAPTDPKITYNLAILYGRADKNDKAVEYLKKTIDLKPDYRDAYTALAIFYEEAKQIDKARETLELILKRIDPNDQETKERLEKLH